MIYITGDTHGDFARISYFARIKETKITDVMVILGDAGVNYHLNERDIKKKEKLKKLHLTILCIRGNHEQRASTMAGYVERRWRGGRVYVELAYPNILFAKDGEVYNLEGQSAIAIGGAYSVDKEYRIERGLAWFENEQLSRKEMDHIEEVLRNQRWKIDVVLSHTLPRKYEPVEVFLPMIDQDRVDKTMETWLDYIEDRLSYKKWYCGHFHTKKKIGNIQILYDNYVAL